MSAKVVPIKVTKTDVGTAHEAEVHEHEAFGMIGLSRVSSSGYYFFGSSIQHASHITLCIQRATMRRHLSREWYSAGERLIEVNLTPAQFSAMITTMNIGDGVPCTLSRVNNEGVAPIPAPRSLREVSDLEVDEHLEKVKEDVEKAHTQLNKMMTGEVSLSKGNLKEAMQLLTNIHRDFGSTRTFLEESMTERVDKQMTEATAAFEAHKLMSIESLGIQALTERFQQKAVGLSTVSDNDVLKLEDGY